MRGAIPPLFDKASSSDAQLKHRDSFAFTDFHCGIHESRED
jgi:hypothetical protein